MIQWVALLSGVFSCFGWSQLASARDLNGRLGLGFNSEFANAYPGTGARFPGISLKYGLTENVAIEGIGGVATTTPSNTVFALKIFNNVFFETHLNFYFMGGLGLISLNGQSGMQILAGVGAEFFIPGIESLGFAVETGFSVDNASGGYSIRTLGVSFLDAGIHFYF